MLLHYYLYQYQVERPVEIEYGITYFLYLSRTLFLPSFIRFVPIPSFSFLPHSFPIP
jgi:hypothetical protein